MFKVRGELGQGVGTDRRSFNFLVKMFMPIGRRISSLDQGKADEPIAPLEVKLLGNK